MSKSTEAAVLDFLTKQNRPFSVNDIVSSLHKEQHGKTAVQKAVDNLVQDGKVREKTYGKQKVYLVDQSKFKESNTDELKSMEKQIEETETSVKSTEKNLKEVQMQLKELTSSMSTDEARKQVAELTEEVESLESRYQKLSSTTVVVDKKERERIRQKRDSYVKPWRTWKRKCTDMLEMILESYPNTKKKLYEDIDIQTDEDARVSFPKN